MSESYESDILYQITFISNLKLWRLATHKRLDHAFWAPKLFVIYVLGVEPEMNAHVRTYG